MKNYLKTYDPFFDFFFPVLGENNQNLMKADVLDLDDSYLLKMNVPGVKKEDIKVSIDNGTLTINVKYDHENETKGTYLFKEREVGEFVRSFKVDRNITNEDISASLEDGVLSIDIQKKKEEVDKHSQYIEIK